MVPCSFTPLLRAQFDPGLNICPKNSYTVCILGTFYILWTMFMEKFIIIAVIALNGHAFDLNSSTGR